jgi:hypothetical protein
MRRAMVGMGRRRVMLVGGIIGLWSRFGRVGMALWGCRGVERMDDGETARRVIYTQQGHGAE